MPRPYTLEDEQRELEEFQERQREEALRNQFWDSGYLQDAWPFADFKTEYQSVPTSKPETDSPDTGSW